MTRTERLVLRWAMLGQLADLVTFAVAVTLVANAWQAESNPAARRIFENHGLLGVAEMKLLFVSVMFVCASYLARRYQSIAARTPFIVVGTIGFFGMFGNLFGAIGLQFR